MRELPSERARCRQITPAREHVTARPPRGSPRRSRPLVVLAPSDSSCRWGYRSCGLAVARAGVGTRHRTRGGFTGRPLHGQVTPGASGPSVVDAMAAYSWPRHALACGSACVSLRSVTI